MYFKRSMFVEFVKAMLTAGATETTNEARTQIIPKMITVDAFVRSSAPPKKSAVGDEQNGQADEDDLEDAEGGLTGIASAIAKAFWEFSENVTQPGRLLADI